MPSASGNPQHMQVRLELEAARERLALDEEQALQLEARHRANEKAIQQLPQQARGGVMLCMGKEAFISLPVDDARTTLKRDNARLWDSIDDLQANITKQARELEVFEEEFKALQNKPEPVAER